MGFREEVGSAKCVGLGVLYLHIHFLMLINRDISNFRVQLIEFRNDLANLYKFALGVSHWRFVRVWANLS